MSDMLTETIVLTLRDLRQEMTERTLAETAFEDGVLHASAGGTGINNSTRTLTINTNSGTLAFASASLTLTIPATGTATLGTGTSGRIAEWSGTNTVTASTLIKSGAGVLTISAASTQTITISGASGGTLALGGFTLTVPATGTATLGTGTSGQIAYWSGTNTVTSESNLVWDATNNRLGVGGTPSESIHTTGVIRGDGGYRMGADTIITYSGTQLWFGSDVDWTESRLYGGGNPGVRVTSSVTEVLHNLLPDGAGARDLGSATLYWNVVNYKTLTDRGCLGWYDDGVELQDGRIVSDLQALREIRPHPYRTTPNGAVRIDYATLPKHVYQPAEVLREPAYNNDGELLQRAGEQHGEDGAELTALVSMLLGAIKELDTQVQALQGGPQGGTRNGNR